ncbi:hypothetical protein [Thalassotalea sediminis]|uniref:hypothetical protein n=1 Tax=Thalassotalea sediminis TaxID=1759089 RepID=UPI002572713D|nr:hypothetical protein [Thalassotalea sediminis]
MSSNNILEIIAPVSALSNRTRLYKLASYLINDKKVACIHHVAWVRAKSEANETELPADNIKTTALINGGGYGGKLTKFLYLIWMIRVFFYCLFRRHQSPVWALGFESAFPALLASKFRKFDIIFDDADRFSLVFPFPAFIKKVIQKLEKYTSEQVLVHVVPGTERYNFAINNSFVLKNTPSRAEVEKAKVLYQQRTWPTAKLIINVNGWLGKDRGMDAALYIAKSYNAEQVQLIVAGKVDCEAAKQLVALNNVTYLGKVSNAMALASYLCADYVLTYYDPNTEINKLAQSNKWGDALCMGTNIIVNSEVVTAQFLKKYHNTIMTPYHDLSSLRQAIDNVLAHGRDKGRIDTSSLTYEQQLEDLFAKVTMNE